MVWKAIYEQVSLHTPTCHVSISDIYPATLLLTQEANISSQNRGTYLYYMLKSNLVIQYS